MLKIIIDGEGSRAKRYCKNWRDAEHEFFMRLSEAQEETLGYNKTWIEIVYNDKYTIKMRLDLNCKSNFMSLKQTLLKQLKYDINFYKKHFNNSNIIPKLKKAYYIIYAIDEDKNNLSELYQYNFYYKGNKIHSYMLQKPATNKEIKTTINILSKEVEGYNKPLNVLKNDIICINKKLKITA